MRGRLIVITGTGTEIGKTHVATALVARAAMSEEALGFKPIESGATGDLGPDGQALLAASHPTFHVKPPRAPYVLPRPVSPHLAARDVGIAIDPHVVHASVQALRATASFLLVELPGGLFSPLGPQLSNANLIVRLAPAYIFLVAPDRLGVLHDVGAATRAADTLGIHVTAVVLNAPAESDASTGTNAAELRLVTDRPALSIARGSIDHLRRSEAIAALYGACAP